MTYKVWAVVLFFCSMLSWSMAMVVPFGFLTFVWVVNGFWTILFGTALFNREA